MSVASLIELLEAGVHFGHQTQHWNPKMKPYLTPETLFGPKFERYLHQQAKAKTIQDISLEEIRRAKEMRDKQNG